jgi:hypothetical protein
MAILDNELIMSNAQAFTTGANASTNSVDFGRAGSGYNKKVLVSVNTTVTSGGAGTVAVAVQHDSDPAFGTAVTLFTTAALAKTVLVAGYSVLEYTLPAEVKQYVRVLYTVATADLTAGKFNAYIDDARQTNMIIM